MTPPPLIRISRFVWLFVGLVVIVWLIYLLRNALLPFLIGGALAYILAPMVSLLERRTPWMGGRPEIKRIILVWVVMAGMLLLIVGVLLMVIPPLVDEFGYFIDALPDLLRQASDTLQSLNRHIIANTPPEIRAFEQDIINNLGAALRGTANGFVSRTLSVVSQTVGTLLGLAIIPLFLFYVLKDGRKIIYGLLSPLPIGPRAHAHNIVDLLNTAFSTYVRAQLLLGLVVGVMVFIGLTLLGVRFAPILGLVAGIFELVPIIGPWLGAIPGIIVVLATAPDKFVWVAALYLGVQLLENSLLVPRIQSSALNIHPVMILVVLIVGNELFGLWGILLGPPLTAAGKEVVLYFVRVWSVNEEPELEPDPSEHRLGEEPHIPCEGGASPPDRSDSA